MVPMVQNEQISRPTSSCMARMWCCLGPHRERVSWGEVRSMHSIPWWTFQTRPTCSPSPTPTFPTTRKEGYSAHAAMYIMAWSFSMEYVQDLKTYM